MADGYYSQLNERVKQLKVNGNVVIDREKIADTIDLSNMDREELEHKCKQAMAQVILYQNGYRSVFRGQGVFVDYEALRSKAVLHKLVNNAQSSVEQKLAAKYALQKLESNAPEEEYIGSRFGWDEEGNLFIIEEMSRRELVEALREIAQ